jgi:threonine dehydrogenase-like Zn-dependent dehydrogenase
MNIWERSGVKKGDLVCIVGIGFLGALLVQLCVNAGARVVALSQRPTAIQIGKKLGAEVLSITHTADVIERFQELFGGEFADVVIEATGKAKPLELAAELTRVRGRLVIAGYHQDGLREINLQLWNWRGFDVINAHERDEWRYVRGIERAVHAVQEKQFDYLPLITHTFPLEKLGTALQLTRDRPEGFMKAVVTM